MPSNEVKDEWMSRLEALLNLVPDFFYVHNADVRFQYINRAAAAYFGMLPEEIIGKTHAEVDPNVEQGERITQLCRQVIAGGMPMTLNEIDYTKRDGSPGVLRAHMIPFADPDSGQPLLLGISRDITAERVLVDEQSKRAAMQRELELARQVQQALLPKRLPEWVQIDIAARCEPATFAGGDFFDAFELPNGNTAVVLGDVSGHGVGPALLAAACRAYARVLLPRLSMNDAMTELDRHLTADVSQGAFVTCAIAIISPQSIEYLSAGHGPTVVLRQTNHELLPAAGVPLGLGEWSSASVSSTHISLEPGDALLLLSDGMIEARNDDNVLFGLDRLLTTIRPHATTSARAMIEAAFHAVDSWTAAEEADDDRTCVIIRR
jgi:PAS domain S-box-containing protein